MCLRPAATTSASLPVRTSCFVFLSVADGHLVAACSAWVYKLEVAHEEHLDHLRHENDGKLPEPPAYEYLNRRVRPYPWGPNTLFFNASVSRHLFCVARLDSISFSRSTRTCPKSRLIQHNVAYCIAKSI